MSQLLNDYLVDISIYRDANHELELYLRDIGDEWAYHNDDIARIYSAMCGNTGGWAQFLQSLVTKCERLGALLVQVSSYCNEIEKRCGAASRRSLVSWPRQTPPAQVEANSRADSDYLVLTQLLQIEPARERPSTVQKRLTKQASTYTTHTTSTSDTRDSTGGQ